MNTISLIVCLFFELTHASPRTVLTYEPAVVQLVGKLELQTFPGPPNYEDIGKGDALERSYFLRLDSPVDVLPKGEHPTVDNPEPERNVRIIQLAISGEDDLLWVRFKKVPKNDRVKIEGTLFHRFNGHHNSRVLLAVDKMELNNP